MEIKVSVDGIPRVVCGITEQTTCQEVVIALAQALGRTGRYTLKEKFKEYERNVTPEEHLLESLRKYGEQVREVHLTLHHNGPSVGEAGPGANSVQLRSGRYQSGSGAQLRRAHIGGHGHRASEGRSLNRQSLPPLSRLRFHSDAAAEEPKKPKRKSLTLMEEAWGWLESLGRSGKQQSGLRDRAKGRDDSICGGTSGDMENRLSQSIFDPTAQVIPPLPQGRNRRDRGQAYEVPKVISCLGTQSSDDQVADKKRGADTKAQRCKKKDLQANLPFLRVDELHIKANQEVEEEKEELRKLILCQQSCLLELQMQVDTTDGQISELEVQQAEEHAAQQSAEAQLHLLEEEAEQLDFWENELKAEEVFERDLLQQFLELKEKAAECKAKLQEYQRKLEGVNFSNSLSSLFPQREVGPKQDCPTERPNSRTRHSTFQQAVRNTESGEGTCPKHTAGKSEGPPVATKPPHVFVAPVQASDSRMSERSQLREWWARWSAGQGSTAGTKPKTLHRSEITIQLNSTRV
ncbi:ras association domain-containing protein 8 [Sardina pilchardus]|uniref:ras association domain-containing protein 8 n=1 Tax=Sardina pilchardus TaxID=27697 RepID=UPI002E0D156C